MDNSTRIAQLDKAIGDMIRANYEQGAASLYSTDEVVKTSQVAVSVLVAALRAAVHGDALGIQVAQIAEAVMHSGGDPRPTVAKILDKVVADHDADLAAGGGVDIP